MAPGIHRGLPGPSALVRGGVSEGLARPGRCGHLWPTSLPPPIITKFAAQGSAQPCGSLETEAQFLSNSGRAGVTGVGVPTDTHQAHAVRGIGQRKIEHGRASLVQQAFSAKCGNHPKTEVGGSIAHPVEAHDPGQHAFARMVQVYSEPSSQVLSVCAVTYSRACPRK